MVGAAHAQAAHGVGRVAVLDFDVHHGNGCAAACWADPTRLYASSHQLGLFPAGPHGVIMSGRPATLGYVGATVRALFTSSLPAFPAGDMSHGATL